MAQALPVVPCNDPTSFCRLCFSQREMHWVIRTNGTEVDAPFIASIGECLGLWLQLDEDFPCAVCRSCTSMLEMIVQFREDSRLCDAALREKRKEDPDALRLFYDYPEDKVFVNGSARPGFIEDDSDFENEAFLPEVILSEKSPKRFRMSASDKARALFKYFESYAKWSADRTKSKDDDEETVVAPESFEQTEDPELRVLCEKYVFDNDDGRRRSNRRIKPPHRLEDSPEHRKNFKCSKCGKTFNSVQSLNSHAIRHQSETLISCTDCGIQFVNQHELNGHLKNNVCRKSEHFVKCRYCDRRFSRRGRYLFHLKRIHSDKPLPRGYKSSLVVSRPSDTPPEHSPMVVGGATSATPIPASSQSIWPAAKPASPRGFISLGPQGELVTIPSGPATKKPLRKIAPRPNKPPGGAHVNSILPSLEEGRFVVLLEPIKPESIRANYKGSGGGSSQKEPVPRKIEQVVCTVCYSRFESIEQHNMHLEQCRDTKGIWNRNHREVEEQEEAVPPVEPEPMEILGD